MTDAFNFNQPPDLTAMKQDIADRQFSIKMKGMLISGAFLAAGLAAMFLFPPAAMGGFAPLLGMAGIAGSALAGMVTMKESKKLEIDEEFLHSRMQGKNYWGGYREEVAETGAPGVSPILGGSPPAAGRRR